MLKRITPERMDHRLQRKSTRKDVQAVVNTVPFDVVPGS